MVVICLQANSKFNEIKNPDISILIIDDQNGDADGNDDAGVGDKNDLLIDCRVVCWGPIGQGFCKNAATS